MRFNLIREPAENPIDLLNSYRQQNIMMQKIRVLHTAFDGIKLTNWSDSNRELPNILIGSVCEFEGRLFEAEDNIILTDSDDSDGERFIRLAIVRENQVIDSDSDYLIAELVSSKMPEYDYYNRGFYSKVDGFIKYKYLRLAMKYSKTLGGYVEKKYWNINDLMRAGITFKKHSVSFGVGTHTFNVPDSANTITVHLVSGGGGGSPGLSQTADSKNAETGGVSKISINNKDITVCGGGVGGYYLGNLKWQMGIGGKASGMGKLIQVIKDEIIGIQLTPLYYNNYLYLHSKFSNGNSITNLDDIKIIDNKICLFNNSIINSAEFSEDFGIYATYGKLPYDNVKYKLKGELILIESQIMTYTNIGMLDFFEDKINYKISTGKENLQIMISNQGAGTILALSGTAGQTYNLDWELPKQPV